MLDVRIDIPAVPGDAFEKLAKLAAVVDTVAILDEAGAILLNRIRTRFLQETDPDGNKWLPSKAAIKRRSHGGTGTLFDTGTLFRSIQLAATGPNERSIQTDVPYGVFHQNPNKQGIRRMFLGFNVEDAAVVERRLQQRIDRALA